MRSFPLFLRLRDRGVVLIGGGEAAARKARLAEAAGARPIFIAPNFDDDVAREFTDRATFFEREPRPADFDVGSIVFVALDNDEDAQRCAEMARAGGALVNVVDRPSLCDFTTPAIVDRGRLTVAFSTDGAAPVFARRLREKIEALAPARIDAALALAERWRERVAGALGEAERRSFWEAVFDGPVVEAALAGDDARAEALMASQLNRAGQPAGVVHLVGAGPGDPDLLTLRALRLLQRADVILYDRLVSDEILGLARRDAEFQFVGKAKSNHAVPQEDIAARMIALAQAGKTVVRLKGGDPFVFGRGGEELAALRDAGVEAHVTPGVTAALGCAASAGIALTHRDYAQSLTIVTGHRKAGDDELDWRALARTGGTLCIYMGLTTADDIASRLMAAGLPAQTPAALIENGTRTDQRIVRAPLSALGPTAAALKGPAMIIIGEAARDASSADLSAIAARGEAA